MAVSVERPGVRPQVISDAAYRQLDEYRAFRHLFRHIYTHQIDPRRIFALMETLEGTWKLVREDLARFVAVLEAADA